MERDRHRRLSARIGEARERRVLRAPPQWSQRIALRRSESTERKGRLRNGRSHPAVVSHQESRQLAPYGLEVRHGGEVFDRTDPTALLGQRLRVRLHQIDVATHLAEML